MNVIVAGAGVGGYHIASMLTREGHSVVVIDQSESALENARRHLDVMTIVGSGSNPRVLRDADASEADLFIAFTASDEANIVACLLAKALGAKRTVARVRNPEYSGYLVTAGRSPIAPRRVVTPQTFGISLFVNPDIMAAEAIVGILFEPYTAPKEEFGGGLVEVRELKVESDAVVDKPLHGIPFPKKCVIGAIVRATGTVFPEDDEILHKDDRVVAVSSPDAMDELEAFFHQKEPHVRSIVIVGGQRVGFRLAQLLEKRGVWVKLIERDPSRCHEVAAQLTRATVVQGDGTDTQLLADEGVPSSDAFIAATEDDQHNVLIALLAKTIGAERSLALVERAEYVALAETVGIDVVVSPLILASGGIVRLVRSPAVVAVAFLAAARVEAIELAASETARIAGRPLAEIELPKDVALGAIIRDQKVSFPESESSIQAGDHVVAVCLSSAVPGLVKLFE